VEVELIYREQCGMLLVRIMFWDYTLTELLVCEPLDEEEHLGFDIIQAGEDENQTFSSGAVVKVSCAHGFGVNLPNDTIRCEKGKWKPKLPQCHACELNFFFMYLFCVCKLPQLLAQ